MPDLLFTADNGMPYTAKVKATKNQLTSGGAFIVTPFVEFNPIEAVVRTDYNLYIETSRRVIPLYYVLVITGTDTTGVAINISMATPYYWIQQRNILVSAYANYLAPMTKSIPYSQGGISSDPVPFQWNNIDFNSTDFIESTGDLIVTFNTFYQRAFNTFTDTISVPNYNIPLTVSTSLLYLELQ